MNPTISPNSPTADAKISTTNMRTNKAGFWASAKAAPLPATPTATPHTKSVTPTVNPDQNSEYPKS